MAGKFGNMFNKAKNRANNGKNFDVMDPSAENPNAKKAKKNLVKALGKAIKQIGKAIYKIGKAIVEALLALGPVGIVILVVLILVLIIAIVITAYNMMPGMMQEKLANLFKIDVDGWFSNGAVGSLDDDYTDIVDVANYLEEMDYNLIGNGFVRPSLRKDSDMMTVDEIVNLHPEYVYQADSDGIFHFYDESGNILNFKYYDSVGQTIDNSTGKITSSSEYTDEFGIIRSTEKSEDADVNDRGKVLKVEESDLKNYRLIRTYLLSNYRIYTLKNADEDVLNDIANAFESLGGNQDAWAKGLIKLYNAKGGIAEGHWWWYRKILGDMPVLNETTLSLKKGWFNNPMDYKIEGWAPRYGMSLDFLISLHLGTNAPDLVYAMLQNFDTEIQVYLDDSGEAQVNARFVDPHEAGKNPASGDSIEKVQTVLSDTNHPFQAWVVNDQAALEWANGLTLTKKACYDLLRSDELTLTSPDNCTGAAQYYIIEDSTWEDDWFFDSNALVDYGIKEDTDEGTNNVYNAFDDYENYTFEDHDGNTDFTVTRCAQSIGTDEEKYRSDNYTWRADSYANSDFGYGEDEKLIINKKQSTKEAEFETEVFTSIQADAIEYYTNYRIEKYYKYGSWYAEVDDEEVEYEMCAYRYVIYETGSTSKVIGTKTSEFTPLDEEKWVDTIVVEYIVREKTMEELIDSGIIDENGNSLPDQNKCSNNPDIKKCCKNCQDYVKAAVKAMAAVSDQSYETYVPYIARVLGSWFRDTYFIVPKEPDAAIKEYAGKLNEKRVYTDEETDETYEEVVIKSTNHPEFDIANSYGEDAKFVQVDEEYLGDSGEYWTAYETKGDNGDYQLYLLNSDGTTSDIKMEDFLKDGAGQELNGNPVTGYPSKEAAEKDGWAFVKKAMTSNFDGFSQVGIDQSNDDIVDKDKLLWSAYGFDTNGSSTNWEKVTRADGNKHVDKLYDIIYGDGSEGNSDSGMFYQMTKTNNVTQVEDAQRSETNALVKYLFKYRQFYIYDGGENRGVQIEHDKQRVLYGYSNYLADNYDFENKYYNTKVIADKYDLKDVKFGTENMDGNFYHYKGLLSKNGNTGMLEEYYGSNWKVDVVDLLNKYGRSALRQSYAWSTISSWIDSEDLAEQWLDWQLDMYYMNKYGVDLKAYYDTSEELLKITYDPRDPDLVSTVEITKSSLSVFSILENTGTLDADYAYRDFKELIVELDYFDKEDLSSKIQTVFTWVLPDVSACGWPNRPWDKQNVDYGTLIQSHDTYAALGVFDGEAGGSFNGDESKIFWIGDSWIVGLKGSGVAKSPAEYFCAVGSTNASNVTVSSNNISINSQWGNDSKSVPSDVSAFVVEFGLNDTSGASKTQELLEKLHTTFPNIPIYVLKTSHVASEYYGGATSMNQSIDKYNSEVQSWCSSNTYVTYVENATKTINGGDGLLSDTYKAGSGDGEYHLGAEGNKVWYQDIIAGLSGGATVGSGTPNQSTVNSTFEIKEGNGDYNNIVIANGVEYKQFDQSGPTSKYGSVNVYEGDTLIRTDSGDTTLAGMGCGIYSSTSLLSGYVEDVNPKKTCQWMHTNIGTSSFNNDGSRNSSITKFLTDNGVPGSWYESDYENKLKEAFKAGKPVIINIKPGSDTWTTSGGHFICFTGISSDGTVYTADSVASGGARLKCNLGTDFDSALSSLVSKLVIGRIWIPDTAPTGAKTSAAGAGGVHFEGYEADQTVTSPVTGKVLEIGKHDRLNVYTGEMEEVEYIKIKVMDSKNYFDSRIDENTDYGYETETDYELADALNLFYKEYEDVCAGYTVMIDGFDVDLETDPEGVYEQNEVHALYNSGQMEIRKNREQAKEDAPYFINFGETEEFPGDEYVTSDPDSVVGYYVKEGKAIGKTIVSDVDATLEPGADPEPTPEPDPEPTPDPDPNAEISSDLPDKLTYTYEDFKDVPGDYMRITVQDTDYALVDDVERFFNIPEPGAESGIKANGDMAAQVAALKAALGITDSELPSAVHQYWDIIKKYSAEFGLDPFLVRALICQESSGDITCDGAALGLMQWEKTNGDPNITFTDANGNSITVTSTLDAMRGNADEQIKVGCAELKSRLDDVKGNLAVALTGYNFGPGGVATAISYHVTGSPAESMSDELMSYVESGDTGWLTDDSRQKASDYWAAKCGWSSYGDVKYVEHVLQYYNTNES